MIAQKVLQALRLEKQGQEISDRDVLIEQAIDIVKTYSHLPKEPEYFLELYLSLAQPHIPSEVYNAIKFILSGEQLKGDTKKLIQEVLLTNIDSETLSEEQIMYAYIAYFILNVY